MVAIVHVVHVVFHPLVILEWNFINVLIIGLGQYLQGISLACLILLHVLPSDVRAFLEHNPDQVLQSEHIPLVQRHQLPLIEAMRQRQCQRCQRVVLRFKDLKVDFIDFFIEEHWIVETLEALDVLDVGCYDD